MKKDIDIKSVAKLAAIKLTEADVPLVYKIELVDLPQRRCFN